jgi:pyridoxine 5-phosphate synthase
MILPRLGVNIDHCATLRQLRGTSYPDIVRMAQLAEQGGADQITVHLREDRRHIQVDDVVRLKKALKVPLNLEMAVTDAMLRFALKIRPEWVCLVPEKRQEVTTEGGLNVKKNKTRIARAMERLHRAKIKVSPFIEPSLDAIKICHALGSNAVELHTGRYASSKNPKTELDRIRKAIDLCERLELSCHAGHGLEYRNVRPLAAIRNGSSGMIVEYNIGHSIVCRAVEVGMERAVREMQSAILAP